MYLPSFAMLKTALLVALVCGGGLGFAAAATFYKAAISSYGNKPLAKALSKAVADVLGLRLRGEDGWIPESASQHSRLLYVRCGGVILELFFISNPRDVDAYKAKKWLVASAIAKVLASEAA